MAALDTNVLVRFLVEDDATQLAMAKALIGRSIAAGETLHIPVTVTLELEWVLRSSFGFDKATIVRLLTALLSSVELAFDAESAIELALFHYGQGAPDFSDCLHVALAARAGEAPLWTFDKAASRIRGARLLTL